MAKHIYMDRDGELWLDPGNGQLLALDDPLCMRLIEAWPQQDGGWVERNYGPLQAMQPRGLQN